MLQERCSLIRGIKHAHTALGKGLKLGVVSHERCNKHVHSAVFAREGLK